MSSINKSTKKILLNFLEVFNIKIVIVIAQCTLTLSALFIYTIHDSNNIFLFVMYLIGHLLLYIIIIVLKTDLKIRLLLSIVIIPCKRSSFMDERSLLCRYMYNILSDIFIFKAVLLRISNSNRHCINSR